MDIILLKDVDKVGEKHTIVKVKDGYGRNFLIPQKLAMVANDSNRRSLDAIRRSVDKKENALLSVYQEMAAKVNGKTMTLHVKAGANGKIYGSVGAQQIAHQLKEQFGLEVERKKIVMEDVKELGTYTATLKLHKEVNPTFTVEVAGKGDENAAATPAAVVAPAAVATTEPEA